VDRWYGKETKLNELLGAATFREKKGIPGKNLRIREINKNPMRKGKSPVRIHGLEFGTRTVYGAELAWRTELKSSGP